MKTIDPKEDEEALFVRKPFWPMYAGVLASVPKPASDPTYLYASQWIPYVSSDDIPDPDELSDRITARSVQPAYVEPDGRPISMEWL